MSSNDRTTSLSELLNEGTESQQPDRQVPTVVQQPPSPLPHQINPEQIMQLREQQSVEQEVKRKTMLDSIKDIDYKSMILVFAIILVLTSGVYSGFSRTYISGSFGPDNRITLLGSVIAAIIGVVLFVLVKFFGKF